MYSGADFLLINHLPVLGFGFLILEMSVIIFFPPSTQGCCKAPMKTTSAVWRHCF